MVDKKQIEIIGLIFFIAILIIGFAMKNQQPIQNLPQTGSQQGATAPSATPSQSSQGLNQTQASLIENNISSAQQTVDLLGNFITYVALIAIFVILIDLFGRGFIFKRD